MDNEKEVLNAVIESKIDALQREIATNRKLLNEERSTNARLGRERNKFQDDLYMLRNKNAKTIKKMRKLIKFYRSEVRKWE